MNTVPVVRPMPRYTWAADPSNIISGFETRHAQPDSGALLAWAVLSVESLHYLADIDQDYEISHHVVGGHSRDIADVAHARWATGTCITSLDLCAAALGRTFCGHKSPRELALSDFDTSKSPKKATKLLAALPRQSQDWMRDLLSDARYKELKTARDWLTHSRVTRHSAIMPGGPPQRLRIDLATTRLSIREVVEHARDLATETVSKLLVLLPQL
jgi:hypothetical protein